jgi:hypothetical protein
VTAAVIMSTRAIRTARRVIGVPPSQGSVDRSTPAAGNGIPPDR